MVNASELQSIFIQYWRLISHQLAFSNSADFFVAQLLLYNVGRHVERQFGSVKYAAGLSIKVLMKSGFTLTSVIHHCFASFGDLAAIYYCHSFLSSWGKPHCIGSNGHYFQHALSILSNRPSGLHLPYLWNCFQQQKHELHSSPAGRPFFQPSHKILKFLHSLPLVVH